MAKNRLFPEFDIPDMTNYSGVNTRSKIATTFEFDIEAGDFVLSPKGTTPLTSAVEAWILWCNKALATERFAHKAYTDNYGIEFEVLDTMDRKSRQNWIERTITETLRSDPLKRTVSVRNFDYIWGHDFVIVSFVVYGHDDLQTQMSVEIAR